MAAERCLGRAMAAGTARPMLVFLAAFAPWREIPAFCFSQAGAAGTARPMSAAHAGEIASLEVLLAMSGRIPGTNGV